MKSSIVAAVLAASLASGCTFIAPMIADGVQSTPARGDKPAAARRSANTALAFAAGLAVDLVVVAAGLDFMDKLAHSGD